MPSPQSTYCIHREKDTQTNTKVSCCHTCSHTYDSHTMSMLIRTHTQRLSKQTHICAPTHLSTPLAALFGVFVFRIVTHALARASDGDHARGVIRETKRALRVLSDFRGGHINCASMLSVNRYCVGIVFEFCLADGLWLLFFAIYCYFYLNKKCFFCVSFNMLCSAPSRQDLIESRVLGSHLLCNVQNWHEQHPDGGDSSMHPTFQHHPLLNSWLCTIHAGLCTTVTLLQSQHVAHIYIIYLRRILYAIYIGRVYYMVYV